MTFNSSAAYQLSHPQDDQQNMIRIVTGVMLGVATLSMILRFVSRKMKNSPLSWEDHTMVLGWVFFVVYCSFMWNVVAKGFGKHTVFVPSVKQFTIALLSLEVTYNPSIICIKGSILLLYNRLFAQRMLRWISWGLWIFTCAYSIAQFFCELFSCYPIASNWDPKVEGHCIDLATVIVSCSILNIVTDVAILSLPMPYLVGLQMSWTRKFQLMGIFLLGGFVCFVSIYRATLVHTVSLLDPAWSDVNGALWSGIELAVAIISGNLPVCRPIYNKIFSHGSTNSGSRGIDPSSGPLSYPKLRPGNSTHEAWVGHKNFERLGPSVDEMSVEMKPLKKDPGAIFVTTTTDVTQETGSDHQSTHSKANIV